MSVHNNGLVNLVGLRYSLVSMGNYRVFRNHFNEWLSQFQAKESTDISDEVYDKILKDIFSYKFGESNNITKELSNINNMVY
mgnify:CR=1 FL=1